MQTIKTKIRMIIETYNRKVAHVGGGHRVEKDSVVLLL